MQALSEMAISTTVVAMIFHQPYYTVCRHTSDSYIDVTACLQTVQGGFQS